MFQFIMVQTTISQFLVFEKTTPTGGAIAATQRECFSAAQLRPPSVRSGAQKQAHRKLSPLLLPPIPQLVLPIVGLCVDLSSLPLNLCV